MIILLAGEKCFKDFKYQCAAFTLPRAFAQSRRSRGFREIFPNFFSNVNQKEGNYIDSRRHSENVEN